MWTYFTVITKTNSTDGGAEGQECGSQVSVNIW